MILLKNLLDCFLFIKDYKFEDYTIEINYNLKKLRKIYFKYYKIEEKKAEKIIKNDLGNSFYRLPIEKINRKIDILVQNNFLKMKI